MPRPIWLLNVLLIALAIGLAAAMVQLIIHPAAVANPRAANSPPRPPASKTVAEEKLAHQLNTSRRPLSEFDSILRGNLFKDPEEEARQKQRTAPLPPLPLLQGTIVLGKSSKAILKQGNREELYEVGDRVAGGILRQIDSDRVVIDYGNRQAEVMLKSALRKLPPPPPTISLQGGGASKARAGAVSRSQSARMGSAEAEAQTQPPTNAPRMRRAQEILDLQKQIEGAKK